MDLSYRFASPGTVSRPSIGRAILDTRYEIRDTSRRHRLLRRVTLYSAAVVLCGSLIVWSTGRVEAISTEAALAQSDAASRVQASLIEALRSGPVSAFDLAERGLALLALADRAADASLYLQATALKDPHYRDAALGAGAAELTLADAAWPSAPQAALTHTKTARRFLELARTIDPIHAETFRLLTIAYTNLGQTQLAADASQKAALFASAPKDS